MKKNIALVLSSGGARGFAHIGVIKELEKHGYKITSIAGSSMGALVGGIYATGQLNKLETWLRSLDVREVIRLTDITISKKGLVKGEKIIKKMKEIIPERNIEDLSIPFCAIATDIKNGKEVVFKKGKLYDAIRASVSIPTVFHPYKMDKSYFVDGGVLNPVPANRVNRQDNDLLVVVNVNARIPFEKKLQDKDLTHEKLLKPYIDSLQKKIEKIIPRNKKDEIGMFNLTNKSISLMLNKISELTIHNSNPDLIINISRNSIGTYDFYKTNEIIEIGERAAKEALDEFN